MKPRPGFALVYLDYSSQEPRIMAHLSGDKNLKAAALEEEFYMEFAAVIGVVPKGAKRKDHEETRAVWKVLFLANSLISSEERISFILFSLLDQNSHKVNLQQKY